MKKKTVYNHTAINVNEAYEAESIEQMLERVMESGEPINSTAPVIYTEKKDGVIAAYNIRTDRFDVALEGFNAIEKMKIAKRDAKGANAVDTSDPKVA